MTEQIYIEYDENNNPIRYAYGEPWVAMALHMGDIGFTTREEAIKWWQKYQSIKMKDNA